MGKCRISVGICLILGSILPFSCTPYLLFQNKDGRSLAEGAKMIVPDFHEHVLQPDDKITISIWGHEDLGVGSSFGVVSSNVDFGKYISIDAKGEVHLPLVGTIKIGGLTEREANLYLEKVYGKYLKSPIIYLRVLNHQVTVLGEVRTPGGYPIVKQRTHIIEMIGQAGGYTDYADMGAIKVIRTHENGAIEELYFDLTAMNSLYEVDLTLQKNDIVYVPERRAKQFERNVGSKIVPVIGLLGTLALIYSVIRS